MKLADIHRPFAPVFDILYGPPEHRLHTAVCARNESAAIKWLHESCPESREHEATIAGITQVEMGSNHWDRVDKRIAEERSAIAWKPAQIASQHPTGYGDE